MTNEENEINKGIEEDIKYSQDKATKNLNLSPNEALQITTGSQYFAIDLLKLPFEQAVQITNYYQYHAINKLKLSFEQALQVTKSKQYHAIATLKLPFEQTVQITTEAQYLAIDVLKLPFEQAIQITNIFQCYAIDELKLPFEQALQITEDLYNSIRILNKNAHTITVDDQELSLTAALENYASIKVADEFFLPQSADFFSSVEKSCTKTDDDFCLVDAKLVTFLNYETLDSPIGDIIVDTYYCCSV